jgi:hypothetical protein
VLPYDSIIPYPLSSRGEDEDLLPENHPKMAAFQHAVKQALERQLGAITEQIRQAEKTLLIRYFVFQKQEDTRELLKFSLY